MKLLIVEVAQDDVFQDLVRVHGDHRPGIDAGRICKMTHDGVTVRLAARGSPNNVKHRAAIDFRTRKALGIKGWDTEADVTFSKANLMDQIRWGWDASEPINRLATRLAVLSGLLGFLGLALGILSFFRP